LSTAFALIIVFAKQICQSCSDNVLDEIITTVRHQWPGDASHILLLSRGDVPLCLLPVQSAGWTVILGGEIIPLTGYFGSFLHDIHHHHHHYWLDGPVWTMDFLCFVNAHPSARHISTRPYAITSALPSMIFLYYF
jgi:hypothetical protein